MKSKRVSIVEMGLRDGLQNEKVFVNVSQRIEMARRLAKAGLKRIEIGAFVREDWVPAMAGSAEVIKGVLDLQKKDQIPKNVEFSALVPNLHGFQLALQSGVKEIAVFAACTESFSKKNINCSIEESFQRFMPVVELAKKYKVKVRGYLSVAFGCPYEGKVPEARVVNLAKKMLKMGIYEVSVGDTIGVAHIGQIESLFKKMKSQVPLKKVAGHFHDTRGQALVNIQKAFQMGVEVFDSSVGGLGGCPYAPGSSGNVATEEVVYMLEGLKAKTGIQLPKLLDLRALIPELVKHELPSRLGRAGILMPKGRL